MTKVIYLYLKKIKMNNNPVRKKKTKEFQKQ